MDTSTTCRMCGGVTQTHQSLSLIDSSLHHLQWAINDLDISLDDGLPTTVCFPCSESLKEWTLFLKKTEKTHELLKNYITISKAVPSNIQNRKSPSIDNIPLTVKTLNTDIYSNQDTPSDNLNCNLLSSFHSNSPNPNLKINTVKEPSKTMLDKWLLKYQSQNTNLRSDVCNSNNLCVIESIPISNQNSKEHKIKEFSINVTQLSDEVLRTLKNQKHVNVNEYLNKYKPLVGSTVISQPSDNVCDAADSLDNNEDENSENWNADYSSDENSLLINSDQIDAEVDKEMEMRKYQKTTGSKKEVLKHKNMLSCSECDFKSNSKFNLELHIIQHFEKYIKFQCHICKKILTSNDTLHKHKKFAHTAGNVKNGYKCNLCIKSYSTKWDLTVHENKYHKNSEKIKCEICFKIFKTKKLLKIHVFSHFNIYTCKECPKMLACAQGLIHHISSNHDNQEFKCYKCSKTFRYKLGVKVHIQRVHCNLRLKKCKFCNKKFNTLAEVKLHEFRHTNKRNFKCATCKKSYKTKQDLNKHFIVHSNERKYKCDQCSSTFKDTSNLCRHKRHVHTTLRPFHCKQCEKTFKSSSDLKDHELKHSNLRQFKCKKCSASFVTKRQLTSHNYKHVNKFTHQCDVCGKKFQRRYLLTAHKFTHDTTRAFKCEICPNKVYKTKQGIVLHFDNYHR